jgi:hypothetical protein
MPTTFARLNEDWNAEPNAPDVRVAIEAHDVLLSFHMNPHQFPAFQLGDRGTIRFSNCWRFRLGATNDEGWDRGQCRFSRLAPAWGEFYEIGGDLRLGELSQPWTILGQVPSQSRHFLFYLRDSTFECDATDWNLIVSKGHDV